MVQTLAPFIDALIYTLEDDSFSPCKAGDEVITAAKALTSTLSDLAPDTDNHDAKHIWITFPRGEMLSKSEYDQYQDQLTYDSYEEYVSRWDIDYPDETSWYELYVFEYHNNEGIADYLGIQVNGTSILKTRLGSNPVEVKILGDEWSYHPAEDDPESVISLLTVLTKAAETSLSMLRAGSYNDFVRENLPLEYRYGVIRRSDWWILHPEDKETVLSGLTTDDIQEFQHYVDAGAEDETSISRIENFTASTFLEACSVAYKACGYDTDGMTPAQQYVRYADGRDDGLLGRANCPHSEGEGTNLTSPQAWNAWYFGKRFGGHPWEICRGYEQIIELRVESDTYKYQYREGSNPTYYFSLAGSTHRLNETVKIFLALKRAGYPVRLSEAEEILKTLKGTDLIGIASWHRILDFNSRDSFPATEDVGDVIELNGKEMEEYRERIRWIEVEEAKLKEESHRH